MSDRAAAGAQETPSISCEELYEVQQVQQELSTTIFKHLRVLRIVGVGGFARVYYADDPLTGKGYALKRWVGEAVTNPQTRQIFDREVQMLLKCKQDSKPGSEYIVTIHGAISDPPYIQMDYIEGMSLHTLMKKKGSYTWAWARQVAFQLACALECVHSNGVIHRDLKSDNCLLDRHNNWKLMLIDFGLSRVIYEEMTRGRGTPHYVAPEVVQTQRYTASADIYSYGIVIWELCTRCVPYEFHPLFDQHLQLLSFIVSANLRPVVPPTVPRGFQNLIVACWDADPQRRPSLHAIKSFLADPAFLTPAEATGEVRPQADYIQSVYGRVQQFMGAPSM